MARKLLTVLLSAALCLGIAGLALAGPGDFSELAEYEELIGEKLTFSEAPEFRAMVAAGELPLVEERLPEEPLVVTPVEEVGQYGGTLNAAMATPVYWYPPTQFGYEPLLILNRTIDKLVPNIAKGWKFSEDNKTFTLYLRKGMKWSDGAPFTADDFMFRWNDITLNDELTPVKPRAWMPGGELMKVKKIDDYTIEYQFAVANPNMIIQLSSVGQSGHQGWCFAPSHALKQYHIKYNPEANDLAKKEDYDNWWELFNYKARYDTVTRRAGIPVLDAWVMEKQTATGVTFKRNPYYWKVDTAGNQLPYIDEVKGTFLPDAEVRVMKVITGETNFEPVLFEGALDKYPLLMNNAEEGGYQVWLEAQPGWSTVTSYGFNQNYEEDPVLGKILQNAKFRQALSLGIDREEINDFLFFGKGKPVQATISSSVSFYEEAWGKAYVEYNPEEANRLLDEIGLKRGKDSYRLRSDGETLGLTIHVSSTQLPAWLSTTELVKSYWEDLGVKVYIKPVTTTYLWEYVEAGEHQVAIWVMDGMTEFLFVTNVPWFSATNSSFIFPRWASWWNTRNEEKPGGNEPPEEIKKLYTLAEKLPYATEEEVNEIAKYILSKQAEELYYIGTVGYVPFPCIAVANMRNIDKVNNWNGHGVGGSRFILAEQLFFKK